MNKPPLGFVPLASLTRGTPDAAATLAEIRRIYFDTTRGTIDNDMAHALALLKSLPSEEERERATVFMHGLSEMQREWQARTTPRDRTTAAGRTKATTKAKTKTTATARKKAR